MANLTMDQIKHPVAIEGDAHNRDRERGWKHGHARSTCMTGRQTSPMGRRHWRRCNSGRGGKARVRGVGAEAEVGSDDDSSSSPSGRLRCPVMDLLTHRYRLPIHDLRKGGPVVIPWGGIGLNRTWCCPVMDLLTHRYRLPLHDLSKGGPVVIPWWLWSFGSFV